MKFIKREFANGKIIIFKILKKNHPSEYLLEVLYSSDGVPHKGYSSIYIVHSSKYDYIRDYKIKNEDALMVELI